MILQWQTMWPYRLKAGCKTEAVCASACSLFWERAPWLCWKAKESSHPGHKMLASSSSTKASKMPFTVPDNTSNRSTASSTGTIGPSSQPHAALHSSRSYQQQLAAAVLLLSPANATFRFPQELLIREDSMQQQWQNQW